MERSLFISIAVLVVINVTDSITGSVIGPTLTFYVSEIGGTTEQYGMIMSAEMLSSFFMMSFYGRWVDSNGNKYKPPYAATFLFGILGQLIYFIAIVFPKGNIAVGALIVSRLVIGLGSAGRTLAYSYVATAVPREKQKTFLTLLSMSRSLGIALGPLMNMLIIKVNTQIKIGNRVIPVDSNNAAGLLLASGELFLLCVVLVFLQEPPEEEDKEGLEIMQQNEHARWTDIAKVMCRIDLWLPLVIMFVVCVNFQTIFVCLPPVARHALGWNPVQISYVSACYSIGLFFANFLVLHLSMKGVSDFSMLVAGNLGFVIFGSAVYFLWTEGAATWAFVLPAVLEVFSYPWIGPANRSKYTAAVHDQSELAGSHGIMQAFLTQAMAIASFLAPTIVSTFVLRSPEDIEAGSDKHELTTGALFGPLCSAMCVVGLFYQKYCARKGKQKEIDEDPSSLSETSPLVSPNKRRTSLVECTDTMSRESEVNRRLSAEIMGIVDPFDNKEEMTLREKILKDMEEWEQINKEAASTMTLE